MNTIDISTEQKANLLTNSEILAINLYRQLKPSPVICCVERTPIGEIDPKIIHYCVFYKGFYIDMENIWDPYDLKKHWQKVGDEAYGVLYNNRFIYSINCVSTDKDFQLLLESEKINPMPPIVLQKIVDYIHTVLANY